MSNYVKVVSHKEIYKTEKRTDRVSFFQIINSLKRSSGRKNPFSSTAKTQFSSFLTGLDDISIRCGLELVTVELSLLETEQRTSENKPNKFFSLQAFWQGGLSLQSAYRKAMDQMTVSRNGIAADTILFHPELYDGYTNHGNSCYIVDIDENVKGESFNKSDSTLSSYKKPPHTSLQIFSNKWTDDPTSKVERQIERFGDELLEVDTDSYAGCTVWVWPILRPAMIITSTELADTHDNKNAGALILIGKCDPESRMCVAESVAIYLNSLVLADLAEIKTELEKKTIITQAALHSVVNILRGMSAEHLFTHLTELSPYPSSLDELNVTITSKNEDDDAEKNVLKTFEKGKLIWSMQELALAMAAVSEIALESEVRSKFQNPESISVFTLIQNILNSFNNAHGGKSNSIKTDFKSAGLTFSKKIIIPKGYLDQRILSAIIYEIFGNIKFHGEKDDNGSVIVKFEVLWEEKYKTCVIKMINVKRENSNRDLMTTDGKYLSNIKEVLKFWNGIKLSTEEDKTHFATKIVLGPISMRGTEQITDSFLMKED